MTPAAFIADAAATGHLRRTLRNLARLDGLSVAIGGLVSPGGDRLVLSELHNLRSCLLRGAVIRPGIGLGGVAMQRRRPVAVQSYLESSTITHQFDRAVQADHIRSAVALPVFVNGGLRAVIYGATRESATFGERTINTAAVIAKRLGRDIEVEEEVRQRLRQIRCETSESDRAALNRHELTELNAELVALVSVLEDSSLRERLLQLSQRLCAPTPKRMAPAANPLSRRESDVLIQLAAGFTNAEIAERLSILPTTVKTHLKSTMRKLGARNRVETVAAARHAGLLP